MTDDTIHTCSYECERPGCIRAQRDELVARLTAETSNARVEVEYEYEVWQGAVLQAGGREADYASAQSEAGHYAAMYTPDGPVEVRIYEKRLLSTTRARPKRRRYDPYGSLSEYGIFSECDAQPLAEEGERDLLAPAMDALAEGRMDALESGSEDGLQAEVEALRAEVERLREALVALKDENEMTHSTQS